MVKSTAWAALAALALSVPALAYGAQQNQHGSMTQSPTTQQQPSGTVGQNRAPKPFATNEVSGKIANVSPSAKEVVIAQPDGQQQSLKLGSNATVFLQGRLGSFSDLKEGQQVRAAYEMQNGQKTLRWIEVRPTSDTVQPKAPSAQPYPGSGGDAPASGAWKGSKTKAQNLQTIEGSVVKVSARHHRLVLNEAGEHVTLQVKRDAKIFVQGKRASLSELKPGDEVRASFETPKTARKIAVRVETVGAKGTAPMQQGAQPGEQGTPPGSQQNAP